MSGDCPRTCPQRLGWGRTVAESFRRTRPLGSGSRLIETGYSRLMRIDGYLPIARLRRDRRRPHLRARRTGRLVDWLCLPNVDSAPVFDRILDANGGRFELRPEGPFEAERRYREGTNVLETIFRTETGAVKVTDALTLHDGSALSPLRELVRVVDGLAGRVDLRWDFRPRLDFGRRALQVRRRGDVLVATNGKDAFALSAWQAGEDRFHLEAGERATFALTHAHMDRSSSRNAPTPSDALEDATACWSDWSARRQLRRAVARRGRPQRARAQAARLLAVRVHRRRPDDLAAGVARRRSQLGLPLRLAARRRVHAARPARARLRRRGAGVLRWQMHATRTERARAPSRSTASTAGSGPTKTSSRSRATGTQRRCATGTPRPRSCSSTPTGRCSRAPGGSGRRRARSELHAARSWRRWPTSSPPSGAGRTPASGSRVTDPSTTCSRRRCAGPRSTGASGLPTRASCRSETSGAPRRRRSAGGSRPKAGTTTARRTCARRTRTTSTRASSPLPCAHTQMPRTSASSRRSRRSGASSAAARISTASPAPRRWKVRS